IVAESTFTISAGQRWAMASVVALLPAAVGPIRQTMGVFIGREGTCGRAPIWKAGPRSDGHGCTGRRARSSPFAEAERSSLQASTDGWLARLHGRPWSRAVRCVPRIAIAMRRRPPGLATLRVPGSRYRTGPAWPARHARQAMPVPHRGSRIPAEPVPARVLRRWPHPSHGHGTRWAPGAAGAEC